MAKKQVQKPIGRVPSPLRKPRVSKKLSKLGLRIKALRIKKGYTNAETFAYEHRFDRSVWWRYERGEDLRYSSLCRVAEAFDMTLEEFFAEGFD